MTGVARESSTDFAGVRVLVVEDEYLIAMDLAYELEQRGATVVGPVASIPDALAVLREPPAPHWVILDVNLGGQLSFPIADALRELSIPFLFTTGYDGKNIPERFTDVPRHQKPTSVAKLQQAYRDSHPVN